MLCLLCWFGSTSTVDRYIEGLAEAQFITPNIFREFPKAFIPDLCSQTLTHTVSSSTHQSTAHNIPAVQHNDCKRHTTADTSRLCQAGWRCSGTPQAHWQQQQQQQQQQTIPCRAGSRKQWGVSNTTHHEASFDPACWHASDKHTMWPAGTSWATSSG